MKHAFLYYLMLLLSVGVSAQVDTSRHVVDSLRQKEDSSRMKIAIFTPLYLDSAFDAGGGYRYDKNFPKFISPGLEFYEGVQLALDTLEKEHAGLDVHI